MLGRIALTNKMVAEDLGYREEVVEGVTGFYFRELEKEMKESEYPSIYIKGLGTFVLNKSLLERRVRYMLYKMGKIKKSEADNPTKDRMLQGMQRETLHLLGMRRRIKKQWERNNGKNRTDNKGKLVQAPGEEPGSVQEEI